MPLFRGIAQPGSAPALGAGRRGFKSLCPDHTYPKFHGGRSSVGRALDCDSSCRGFETRRSPQIIELDSSSLILDAKQDCEQPEFI